MPKRPIHSTKKNTKSSFFELSKINNNFFTETLTLKQIPENEMLVTCMLSNNPLEMREMLSYKLGKIPHPSSLTHYFARHDRSSSYTHIREFQLQVIERAETTLNRIWLNKSDIINYCNNRNDSPKIIGECFRIRVITIAAYLLCKDFDEVKILLAQFEYSISDEAIEEFETIKEMQIFYLNALNIPSKFNESPTQETATPDELSNVSSPVHTQLFPEEDDEALETQSSTSENWYEHVTPEELDIDGDEASLFSPCKAGL